VENKIERFIRPKELGDLPMQEHEKKLNVNRFVFETPFTRRGPDGKVTHGDVSCQWKVKTILTTEARFPYLKTRIKVVSREDVELTPVQVSIEDLERKLIKLETACGPPLNLIMLQMELQSCVATAVNAGPLQIVEVFLSKPKLDCPFRPRMKEVLRKLLRVCHRALLLNKMHLRPGQEDLHIHLARSYKKFKVEVEKVVGEVHIGDGHKAMTATSVIAGLVGSQRATKSLQKKLEGDNSPVPTRSKSLRMRGSSSDSHGVAKSNKGNRRSFAVMHSSLDSSI